MQLRFFGGVQEVGRSSILLKDGRSIMMDFGLKIEEKNPYPIAMPNVDALIVSHAHLDHCGAAPALYRYEHMPTFGTKPTLDLSMLLLQDALNVSRKNHVSMKYSKRQVETYKNRFTQLQYNDDPYHFGNFDISLYDAGHICGSAVTLVDRANGKDNKRVVYTGDFKLQPQMLHNGAEIVKSDVLVIESTYESIEHPNRNELMKRFVGEIQEVLDNGGTALVPAFAVGRSQELLSILYKSNLGGSVYIDGMCREATRIVTRNDKFINNGELLSKAIHEATWIDHMRDRNSAVEGPSIILTTAGMLNGGPVLSYITKLNSNSRIFITGYQVQGTNGRSLMEHGYIKLDKKKVKITTPFSVYDFSAHAGNSDLFRYVRESSPNTVICVHGDQSRTKHFAEELKGEGFDAFAPKIGETITLKD